MLPISSEGGLPKRFWYFLLLVFAMVVSAGPVQAQQSTSSPPAPASTKQAPLQDPAPKTEPALEHPKEQKPTPAHDAKPLSPEEARQAQLLADTNKLYELAQELQAEVAKSNKNTLSLGVVKKAAEVEKLAKSLKERMKPE